MSCDGVGWVELGLEGMGWGRCMEWDGMGLGGVGDGGWGEAAQGGVGWCTMCDYVFELKR